MNKAAFQQTFNLPFKEASQFFRDKVNIPTNDWHDLWQAEHAKGFMSAGAMKADLLADLRGMVDKAVAGGVDIKDFRNEFRALVEKSGWQLKGGGPGWRADLIYRTNIATAYQAGRWQQMEAAGVTWLRYVHADGVRHPRPHHVAMNGIIRKRSDAFWSYNYPPNGWRCHCRAVPVLDKDAVESPRPAKYKELADEGWRYNVGEAAYGQRPDLPTDKWEPLHQNWKDQGRPKQLPFDPVTLKSGQSAANQAEMVQLVKAVIGGEDKVYIFEQDKLQYGIRVNAGFLGSHLPLDRAEFIPYLADLLTNPAEVWLDWEKNSQTGKVRMAMNIVKGIDQGKGKTVFMTARAVKGELLSWTFIPSSNPLAFNKDRSGFLAFAK